MSLTRSVRTSTVTHERQHARAVSASKTSLVRTVQHGFAASLVPRRFLPPSAWVTVAYLLRDAFFLSGVVVSRLALDKRTFVLRADVNEENGSFSIASQGLLAAGG